LSPFLSFWKKVKEYFFFKTPYFKNNPNPWTLSAYPLNFSSKTQISNMTLITEISENGPSISKYLGIFQKMIYDAHKSNF
jgi:hypothetical protein